MTTLHLVRHGETVFHAENRYAGSTDVALTDHGVSQSQTLGRWAATQPIVAVYSSDLSRALLTAAPAATALGVEVRVDSRLREVHFGRGEGLTTAEMQDHFADAVEQFHQSPAHQSFPDGERGVDAVARAWPALEQISAAHGDDTVLIVMHSTLMRLILSRVLGAPLDGYRTTFPNVKNAAVTTISLSGGTSALHGFNIPTC